MFKNLSIYRLSGLQPYFGERVEDFGANVFYPCTPSQDKSIGWVPPRGEDHGALVESVDGQWVVKLMFEAKKVPSDVLNRAVAEQAKIVEDSTGRKIGKAEKRELKEDTRLSLLPTAFPSRTTVMAWIDTKAGLLCIDSVSQSKIDILIAHLIRCMDGVTITQVCTTLTPVAGMAEWLTSQDAPAGFTIDRECELKSSDETKSVVKYGRHALDTDEVRAHIAAGKLPTKLAMSFEDRVSFLLTDTMQLKKLTFLDSVFSSTADHDDGFDADLAIATGELKRLIPALFDAFGGVVLGS